MDAVSASERHNSGSFDSDDMGLCCHKTLPVSTAYVTKENSVSSVSCCVSVLRGIFGAHGSRYRCCMDRPLGYRYRFYSPSYVCHRRHHATFSSHGPIMLAIGVALVSAFT